MFVRNVISLCLYAIILRCSNSYIPFHFFLSENHFLVRVSSSFMLNVGELVRSFDVRSWLISSTSQGRICFFAIVFVLSNPVISTIAILVRNILCCRTIYVNVLSFVCLSKPYGMNFKSSMFLLNIWHSTLFSIVELVRGIIIS